MLGCAGRSRFSLGWSVSVSLFYSGGFFTPNLPHEGLLPREPVEGSRSLVLLRRRPKVSALLAAVTRVVISWLCIFVQYQTRFVNRQIGHCEDEPADGWELAGATVWTLRYRTEVPSAFEKGVRYPPGIDQWRWSDYNPNQSPIYLFIGTPFILERNAHEIGSHLSVRITRIVCFPK